MHLDDGLEVMSRDFTVYIITMSRHVPLQRKTMPGNPWHRIAAVCVYGILEQTQSQV